MKQLSKYNPFSHRQLSQFGRTYAFYLRRWRPSGTDDQLSAQRKATEVLTSSSNRLDFAFLYNFRDTFYNETGVSCPRRGNCTLIFRLVSKVFHLLSTPTLTPSVDSWAPAACLSSLHYLFFLYNINIQLLLFVFWLLPIPLLTRVFKKVVHKVLDLASSFFEFPFSLYPCAPLSF